VSFRLGSKPKYRPMVASKFSEVDRACTDNTGILRLVIRAESCKRYFTVQLLTFPNGQQSSRVHLWCCSEQAEEGTEGRISLSIDELLYKVRPSKISKAKHGPKTVKHCDVVAFKLL
jgi:hypothetical protein